MILPDANDWDFVFRPAVFALLNGMNIYDVMGFFNVPWTLFILIPFAVLPSAIGRWLILVFSIAAFGLIAWRFKAKPLSTGFFILSPFTFNALSWGNVEWLTLLGLVAHPSVGILLMLIKPQLTIFALLLITWQTFQSKGIRGVIRLAIIPTIAVCLSIIVFGFWFLRWTPYLGSERISTSLSFFPISIPIGFILLGIAFYKNDLRYALAASPWFFPVLSVQSWLIVQIPLLHRPWVMIITCIVLWIIWFYVRGVF